MKNNIKIFLYTLVIYCLVISQNSQATEETGIRFERLWPKITQPWYFNRPNDIAVDNKGDVYIVDTDNHRIQKFTETGDFIRGFGAEGQNDGQFETPVAIAVGADGQIYVSDKFKHQVHVFTNEGVFISSWGGKGSEIGQLREPGKLAIDQSGQVYVVDGGNARIQVFTAEGEFLRSWGEDSFFHPDAIVGFRSVEAISINSEGLLYVTDRQGVRVFSQEGEFLNITWGEPVNSATRFKGGIAIDSSDQVYAFNQVTDQIEVFTAAGELITSFAKEGQGIGEIDTPLGLAISQKGQLFVADTKNNRIQKMTANGESIQIWQSGSDKGGFFRDPVSMATDFENKLYVTDSRNNRIQVFNQQGELIRSWGSKGHEAGQFNNPRGIAIDSNDLVYVVDTLNNRIQVFDTQGDFIRQWGSSGVSPDKFQWPTGIAIDKQDRIYIADSQNFAVKVFDINGFFLLSFEGEGINGNHFDVGEDFKWVNHIAISPAGELFVSDFQKHRISAFDTSGRRLRYWGEEGSEPGQLKHPRGLSFDQTGLLYVTDSGNNRIQLFNQQGEFVQAIGEAGVGPKQFSDPIGIHIDSENKLRIADTRNNRIQAFRLAELKIPFKAIILAGGGPSSDTFTNFIWDDTLILANKAYRALRTQGLANSEIKFLTAGNVALGLDGAGNDLGLQQASLNSLEDSLINWATDAENVLVYLIDHGGPGRFQVNDTEILTETDLKNWVSQLDEKISGKITVIIEACKSGSFLSPLASPERFLISSADADQPAVISNKGLNSFSYYFWSEIGNGANLNTAFKKARQGMSRQFVQGRAQNAQLDSNGDQKFDSKDSVALSEFCLGACTTYAAIAPVIETIPQSKTLQGETALELTMQVSSVENILQAWAVITRPDFDHPDSNAPVVDLPKLELLCNETQFCSANYEQFDVQGNYLVNFYVQDETFQLAASEQIIITQTQGRSVKNGTQLASASYDEITGRVIVDDVHYQFGSDHFRLELVDTGNLLFKLDTVTVLDGQLLQQPNVLNFGSSSLQLNRVSAFDRFFKIDLQHEGDFVFSLGTVEELGNSQ